MPDRAPSPWNVPNAICVLRLVGTPVLVWLAWRGDSTAFAWLFAALFVSDWIDGKLAILLDQRTTIGARLDSAADWAMYGALLLGAARLHGDAIRGEWIWIGAAVLSWAAALALGKRKFGRFPSYHTRAAKTSWLLIGIGAFSLFAGGPLWPLRVALAAIVLANVESLLITRALPRWRADVPSLFHARRE